MVQEEDPMHVVEMTPTVVWDGEDNMEEKKVNKMLKEEP